MAIAPRTRVKGDLGVWTGAPRRQSRGGGRHSAEVHAVTGLWANPLAEDAVLAEQAAQRAAGRGITIRGPRGPPGGWTGPEYLDTRAP